MKSSITLVLLACVVFLTPAIAQRQIAPAVRTCGLDHHHQHVRSLDSKFDARVAAIEAHTQQAINSGTLSGSRFGSVITIPVVVHVVYNSGAENLSLAQIQSQIDILNEDFRRLNADAVNTPSQFAGVAADVELEFCLASFDPSGQPTDGVTRTPTSATSFSANGGANDIQFSSQNGKDAWPRADYLNIWVGDISGGILGYAQFPGGPAATDGVVCDYLYFGNIGTATAPFNLGRTATHEVGHWLNLRHIWGNGGGCGDDDLVSDTPNQSGPNYGCPGNPSSCTARDMAENYMDYTDDSCMNIFTQGQKSRMLAQFAPGGARESILSSTACVPPVSEYQVNQPGASVTIDGVVGNAFSPAVTSQLFGQSGSIDLSSNSGATGFDLAIVAEGLVPASNGGITTAGGQFVNIRLSVPTLSWLNSGTAAPTFATWGGPVAIPYTAPAATLTASVQMVKLDPSNPDGLVLSQGAQLNIQAAAPLPSGPTGDDSSVTLDLASIFGSGLSFYGTNYNQAYVSSNGRILFGGEDTDFSPSVNEISNDNPHFGFWTDLDVSAGGSISFSSPAAGVLRVNYNAVPYFATTTTVSFALEIDVNANTCTISGLSGITANPGQNSTGDRQFMGITRGNSGGTRPARISFTPGGSGSGSPTDAIYDYCNNTSPNWSCGGVMLNSSLQSGVNRIVFTPLAQGGYSWAGF